MVWLLDERAERGSRKSVCMRSLPQSRDWGFLTMHLGLELGSTNRARKLRQEGRSEVSARDTHVGKAEREINISTVLDEVHNCEPNSVQCAVNDLLAEAGTASNGHGVGVDTAEALLVDRVLTTGRRDLLLAGVANEVCLDGRVDAEHGLHVMHILSFHSHGCKINLRANISRRDLRQLGGHVEGEGTELLNVDTSAGSDVVAEVLAQRLPNDEHLSLGLQRLQVGAGTLGGLIMNARVVCAVLENPIQLKEKRQLNGLLKKESCRI